MYKEIKSVSIRDFNEEDIDKKIEWINNPENNRYLHYDIPLEYSKTKLWFENKDNQKRLDCVIEYNKIPVGLIGLLAIDQVNCKAEYYVTIGNTNYKKKGIASTATILILEYAFEDLKLNKVYLNVDADNVIACKLYERVGFDCEGYFHDELLRGNQLIDRKRYAFLKKNWKKK